MLEEALQAGVDSFLPKPLFAASVLEEFRFAMQRKCIQAKKQQAKADLRGRNILLQFSSELRPRSPGQTDRAEMPSKRAR